MCLGSVSKFEKLLTVYDKVPLVNNINALTNIEPLYLLQYLFIFVNINVSSDILNDINRYNFWFKSRISKCWNEHEPR